MTCWCSLNIWLEFLQWQSVWHALWQQNCIPTWNFQCEIMAQSEPSPILLDISFDNKLALWKLPPSADCTSPTPDLEAPYPLHPSMNLPETQSFIEPQAPLNQSDTRRNPPNTGEMSQPIFSTAKFIILRSDKVRWRIRDNHHTDISWVQSLVNLYEMWRLCRNKRPKRHKPIITSRLFPKQMTVNA